MLDFTVRIDGAYIADGDNGMEYAIKADYSQPKGKKCVVTIRQNGVDSPLGSMRFRDLRVAMDWCNKDNDYLANYL